jgi:UDP-N-acetyl-D-glucosamine dehydrogenase
MLDHLIKEKKARVAVVGLGYVGLPTAIAVAEAGFSVVGIDTNEQRVKQLTDGRSFMVEIANETIKNASKNFYATNKWSDIKKCRVVIIAVPTPLTKNKTPDTSHIENAVKNIAPYLRPESLVILESTTYPGTTEELVKPNLPPCYLAFAPERIDPGNKAYKFVEVPKVIGGLNKKSAELAGAFYGSFIKKIVTVSSPRAAEMTKLLENIFRLVNISMINELKMLGDKLDIDIHEVIEAAKTKPYGFMPFYPGPGAGGHCIPLDPFYLSWKAREVGFFARFIELAGEINELMPHYVVTRIIWALNQKQKAVNGSKILVLGVAYKKDIDDARESPSLAVIKDLMRKKAQLIYNDPHVPQVEIGGGKIYSTALTDDLLKRVDCVVILTDHSAYDYAAIFKKSKLIVDIRNAIKKKDDKVVR